MIERVHKHGAFVGMGCELILKERSGGAGSGGVYPALHEVIVHQTESLQDGSFALARLVVAVAAQEGVEELADRAAAIRHIDDVRGLHRV